MYTPPFTISPKIISLVAEISAQIGRYAIRMEQGDALSNVGVNEKRILENIKTITVRPQNFCR